VALESPKTAYRACIPWVYLHFWRFHWNHQNFVNLSFSLIWKVWSTTCLTGAAIIEDWLVKCCGSQPCVVVKRKVSWRLSPTPGEEEKRETTLKTRLTNKQTKTTANTCLLWPKAIHVLQGQTTVGITLQWIYSWHPLSCESDTLFPLDATKTNLSCMGLKINGLCWYNFN